MSSGDNPSGRGRPRPLSGGPVKFGPYWLDARFAVGGTGEVYVARPLDPEARPRKLIVKRLLPQFAADPEGRTMFEREAALHAAVTHPNVVEVYASGVEGAEPWLAMELVDGCDLFRLLRRMNGDRRKVANGIAAYIVRELLSALESVHTARDAAGHPMGIIHRDVTPSNVYLSIDGRVKLGDFGIARSASRQTLHNAASAMLKGKFAYLAPEQVAGEPFDQRADLFSAALVLSEMLLGQPLFAGSGQLAILLAIRDCRIDPLRAIADTLPPGLFAVLERALARDPGHRFPSAAGFAEALAPFDSSPTAARAELGALVRWVQSAPSVEQMQAVREGVAKARAVAAARDANGSGAGTSATGSSAAARQADPETTEYTAIASHVTTANGRKLGPWNFGRLVEAIATGQVGRGDRIDYMGRGPAVLESIDDLARFLPAMTPSTTAVGAVAGMSGVGAPDFVDEVSPSALVRILLRAIATDATGVLFAERPAQSDPLPPSELGRKEIYFVGGKLHHVASNSASELLGESLVRRQVISREELDFALAVLPRYGGRMGDTLIALGLVASLDIFRAIRDQGRDRLVDLFRWPTGKVTFYAGQTARHVEFPLALDLAPLVIAGVTAAARGPARRDSFGGDAASPLDLHDRLDDLVGLSPSPSQALLSTHWPSVARRVMKAADRPAPLRRLLTQVLAMSQQVNVETPDDILGAVAVLLAAELLVWLD